MLIFFYSIAIFLLTGPFRASYSLVSHVRLTCRHVATSFGASLGLGQPFLHGASLCPMVSSFSGCDLLSMAISPLSFFSFLSLFASLDLLHLTCSSPFTPSHVLLFYKSCCIANFVCSLHFRATPLPLIMYPHLLTFDVVPFYPDCPPPLLTFVSLSANNFI